MGDDHLSTAFLLAVKLAYMYIPDRLDGRARYQSMPLTNCQYANSPGNRAYCYAELTVSSLAVA